MEWKIHHARHLLYGIYLNIVIQEACIELEEDPPPTTLYVLQYCQAVLASWAAHRVSWLPFGSKLAGMLYEQRMSEPA
jgi:hypothetical protein